jgi:ketosteroid isomerase-like protein
MHTTYGEDDMTLTADDRLAILEVIARYNRLADERDVEGTVALYTDTGYIDGDFSTGVGPDGLRADLPGIFAMEGTLKRHISINHLIDGDGARATVRSLLLVVEGETLPAVGATADITDELHKQDGRWLLARHHVAIDPAMRNAMAGS